MLYLPFVFLVLWFWLSGHRLGRIVAVLPLASIAAIIGLYLFDPGYPDAEPIAFPLNLVAISLALVVGWLLAGIPKYFQRRRFA